MHSTDSTSSSTIRYNEHKLQLILQANMYSLQDLDMFQPICFLNETIHRSLFVSSIEVYL